jgi:hypothetical protein
MLKRASAALYSLLLVSSPLLVLLPLLVSPLLPGLAAALAAAARRPRRPLRMTPEPAAVAAGVRCCGLLGLASADAVRLRRFAGRRAASAAASATVASAAAGALLPARASEVVRSMAIGVGAEAAAAAAGVTCCMLAAAATCSNLIWSSPGCWSCLAWARGLLTVWAALLGLGPAGAAATGHSQGSQHQLQATEGLMEAQAPSRPGCGPMARERRAACRPAAGAGQGAAQGSDLAPQVRSGQGRRSCGRAPLASGGLQPSLAAAAAGPPGGLPSPTAAAAGDSLHSWVSSETCSSPPSS